MCSGVYCVLCSGTYRESFAMLKSLVTNMKFLWYDKESQYLRDDK